MLQAVLAGKAGLELPSFLLVSFMPPMHVEEEGRNASPRIVCAASAATILRALITAGKVRMASSMIEDYLLEYALAWQDCLHFLSSLICLCMLLALLVSSCGELA